MFPTDIASGDVNGDNISDIIASNSGEGTISVLLNLGDGTFAEAINFDVGSTPLAVDMTDLNGDGDRDVAVVADDPEIGPSVQVLTNTVETGEFDLGSLQAFSVQATPNFVASGDMNEDGIGDLVTVNGGGEEDGSVSALLSEPQTVAFPASLDIRPGGCPNPLNPNSNGVLPIGLLGRRDFNAKAVDLSTLRLERPAIVGSVAFPSGSHTQIKDVGTPFDGDPCDCHALAGDGVDDVSMKFNTPEVAGQFELAALPGGSTVELELRGSLLDGTPFVATDCVRIVPTGPGMSHDDTQEVSAGPSLDDILDAWGPCGSGRECGGDLDGDGTVGIRDVMIWISGER
jgi:hypothetical protein